MNRDHVEGILAKRIEEYMREAEADLKLREEGLKEKAMLRSSLAAKWLRYAYEENAYKNTLLNQIDKIRESIKQKLYEAKKHGIENQSTAVDKLISVDTEKLLVQDINYKKLKCALATQEDIIRLINEIQKIISAFGYDIANARGVIQLEQI
jgi:hypothetical protein